MRENRHFTHIYNRRAKGEGGGEGAKIEGYAVGGRSGHIIAITRKAGKIDDGDRDCVLVVRAYSRLGEHRDNVPANERRVQGVFHHQCSTPGKRTNKSSLCT